MSREETIILQSERRRSARILALEEKERLEKENKKASVEAKFNSKGKNTNRRGKGKGKHKSLGELISVTQGMQPPQSKYYSRENEQGVCSVQRMPENHVLVFVLDLIQSKSQSSLIADYVNYPREVEDCYHRKTMEFWKIRAKLREGFYTTLDQFEVDIYSLCENIKNFTSSSGGYNKQASLFEYIWRLLDSLRTDVDKFRMEFGLISKNQCGNSGDGTNMDFDHYRPGSDDKDSNVSSIERRNSYKPYCDGKPHIITDFVAPKTLVPIIGGNIEYRETLLRYVQHMGSIPKAVAENKIDQLEDALAAAASYGWMLQPTHPPETSNGASFFDEKGNTTSYEKGKATTFQSSILADIESLSRIIREGKTQNDKGADMKKTDDDDQGGNMDLERYLKGKGICTVDDDDEYLTLNDLNNDNIQHEQQPILSDLVVETLQWNSRNWMTCPTFKPKNLYINTSGTSNTRVLPTVVVSGRESKQEEVKSVDCQARPFWLPSQSEETQVLGHSQMTARTEGHRAQGHSLFSPHLDQGLQGLYPCNETVVSMSLNGNRPYSAMPSLDFNTGEVTLRRNPTTDCSYGYQGLPMEIDILEQSMFAQQQVQVASSCDMTGLVGASGPSGPTDQGQAVNDQCLWELQLLSTPTAASDQPNLSLQL